MGWTRDEPFTNWLAEIWRDMLSHVRTKALVIHRRKDRAIPLEAGQRLAAAFPRARLITLDGDIHLRRDAHPDPGKRARGDARRDAC